MSDKTSIEWTATINPDGTITKGATWNPVRGCVKVSPGCAHCYAETFAERFRGVPGHPYEQGFDLRLVPEKLTEPLSWKKPRRVFVNSMSDLFQDGVPDAYIDRVFAVMGLAHQHTFQILTKRADRMRAYVDRLTASTQYACGSYRDWPQPLDEQMLWLTEQLGADRIQRLCEVSDVSNGWPHPNVWLGVSVENQHFADERIPLLLQTPAAVRFISAEPLLAPVDIAYWLSDSADEETSHHGPPHLDWVIVGGESGHGARKFDVRWARDIVAQCAAAQVPVFVKQLGAVAFDSALGRATADYATHAIGATDGLAYLRLRQSKGGDMAEWPEDLQVRQFPEARV